MTLFAWLLITAPLTGGLLNPAVTLGIFICNKTWSHDIDMFIILLFAQFMGAFGGCFMSALHLICFDEKVPRTAFDVPIYD
jgi:glycerol uptake facilitator-like aquaporin